MSRSQDEEREPRSFAETDRLDSDVSLRSSRRAETWSDLKPYVKCLIAANFISIICGINDGSLGVIIPRLKSYYNVPNETVSLLFLFNSFGYFLAAGVNGFVVQKVGQLNALYIGGCLVLLAYGLLSNGFAFPIQSCIMPLQGAGIAFLDAGMNVYASGTPMATLMLNILHAMYGIGAMLSPIIGTILLAHDISWRGMYAVMSVFAVVNVVTIFIGLRNNPVDNADNADDVIEEREGLLSPENDVESYGRASPTPTQDSRVSQPKSDDDLVRRAIMNPMSLLGAAYILVYVGTEVTVGGWGFTYLTEGRNGEPIQVGQVIAGYWFGLAAGRIILGFITEKFGIKRMISLFTVMTAVLCLVLWWVDNLAVDYIAIVFIGFALGPMFPSTIALASKVLPRKMHAAAIGFMAGLGAGGAALFPFLTGLISGKFGILVMPIVVFVMSLGMQILWTFVPSDRSKKNERRGE
ncbi:major facilitator superfamily domain-containing protein [Syncephalastrum racemosum]|uniref:Major facilitator superfamily domain-containing protein n=1 Tax=Syncephalastrum racemosum TaxID=13706 RepID=A0A1X2H8G2_SYNRA|nr:major facilitator superfamily domain-containing protein [Syncephalastrum racemosum]